jgi:epoxyqueuosine reductase QueG
MISELKVKIAQLCPSDVYDVGYASMSGLLRSEYAKYPFGISLARKMDDLIIDQISSGPTKAYSDLYSYINNELNSKIFKITKVLKANNIEAYPVKATVDDSELDKTYGKTLRYWFSHKMIATRAGIGWIGKTDLLISKRFGPRVRLASILTGAAVSNIGIPINESQCGTCNICVENCPAEAATGKTWSIQVDRNVFYDPFKCRDFCRTISYTNLKKEISLCGICVSVCPRGIK